MTVFGWIILGGLAVWLLVQRVGLHGLRHELESTRRDMYRGQYDAEEKLHRFHAELALLKMEARVREGGLRVGPNVPVSEAIQLHPRVRQVLQGFHITVGDEGSPETLAEAASAYSQDLEAVLTAIHNLLENPDAVIGGPQLQTPTEDAFDV